jgi:DNA-binding GntR family transcriptional regulator
MSSRASTPPATPDSELTQDRQVAEGVIEDIIAGRHPPGTWLREREITEAFGVSHGPVREALRHVARAGFVELVPWRGARVIDLTPELAIETLEIWKASFGVLCRLAAQRLEPSQHIQMIEWLEKYELVVSENPDPERQSEAARSVCRFIAENARAPMVDEVFHRACLMARWQRNHLGDTSREARLQGSKQSSRLLRRLCSAILAQDPDESERCARQFLEHAQSHIRDVILGLRSA